MLNTVIIIVEADIDANLTQGHVGHELDLCETLNLCFGVVYVIEMLSKIVILGQQNYWLRLQHRFDAFTTSLVIVGQIIQAVMNAHEVPLSDVIQYILLLRLTRTLRLVVVVRRFNEIFNIFIALLPAFSTLFGMMWTVFSVYASVGMVLFGGKVTTNSTVLQNRCVVSTVCFRYWTPHIWKRCFVLHVISFYCFFSTTNVHSIVFQFSTVRTVNRIITPTISMILPVPWSRCLNCWW